MSKLPDIVEPAKLERIIREKPGEIIHNDIFRRLVLENVKKMPDDVRKALMHLMQVTTMNENG